MMHGGKSRGGVASPSFKNGRYSRYTPQQLLEHYTEILNDPRLLEMSDDLALFHTLITSALEDWTKAEGANTSGEMSDEALWRKTRRRRREIGRMLLTRAKLVLTETTRQASERQTLTVEQALAFATALADSVRSHVSDKDVLNAIAADINRITSGERRG